MGHVFVFYWYGPDADEMWLWRHALNHSSLFKRRIRGKPSLRKIDWKLEYDQNFLKWITELASIQRAIQSQHEMLRQRPLIASNLWGANSLTTQKECISFQFPKNNLFLINTHVHEWNSISLTKDFTLALKSDMPSNWSPQPKRIKSICELLLWFTFRWMILK